MNNRQDDDDVVDAEQYDFPTDHFLSDYIIPQLLGQCITQFLCQLELLHQFPDALHITPCLSHLRLNFLHPFLHDVHAQVENQMLYMLAQTTFTLTHLKAPA
jgi:hypothetical protein